MPGTCLRALETIPGDSDPGVHRLRRAAKTWRSLLRLAPDALAEEARAARATLNHLRRSFGTARDEAVILRRLIGLKGVSNAANLAGASLPDLETRHRIADLATAQDSWRLPLAVSPVNGEVPLVEGLTRAYRRARRLARKGVRDLSLKRLHRLRTLTVDLGEPLAFLVQAGLPGLMRRVRAAERLRQELGRVVDGAITRERLDTLEISAKDRKNALRHLSGADSTARRRADAVARELYAMRPRELREELMRRLRRHPPAAARQSG